jgi:hypothetical protein
MMRLGRGFQLPARRVGTMLTLARWPRGLSARP